MVYLFGWAVLYFGLAMQGAAHYRGRVFLFFALGFFATMALLRGAVGTDTANYELMLGSFIDGYAWDGTEPGFVGIGWLLTTIAPNTEFAVRAIAAVFFSMLALFLLRSDSNERFLLIAYIMPAFAYLYSMNALRIGIASAVLLIAVQLLRKRGAMSALTMGLISVMFHYSAAFTLLYVTMSRLRWTNPSSLLILMLLLACMTVAAFAADFYFMDKLSLYQEMQSPNPLSGIGKIVPIVLMMLGIALGELPRLEKIKLISMALSTTTLGWVLTQYSYAGLRLLDLISFALPIALLASYSRLRLIFDLFLKGALLLAGLVSAAFVYRGFLLEQGEGETPFLPYETFWFF